MVWMGSKTNIAAITALDVTPLQDNIVFFAVSELKSLLLQKTSVATVNSTTVWAAVPSGRWCLVGGGSTSSIEIVANLAGLKALTTAFQDRFYILDSTPPVLYSWDAQSTATEDDNLIVKLTSVATGRMYKIYPSSGGSNTTISSTPPSTVLASGTVYVWAENDTTTYPPDSEGRYPNSLITYTSNGTVWLVTNANDIFYAGDPATVGKLPNSVQEGWVDTDTSTRYGATINSSSVLSWEVI